MGSFEFCVQEITCRDRLCIDLTLLYPGKLTNLGNEAQMAVDSRSTDEASKEKFVHLLPLKKASSDQTVTRHSCSQATRWDRQRLTCLPAAVSPSKETSQQVSQHFVLVGSQLCLSGDDGESPRSACSPCSRMADPKTRFAGRTTLSDEYHGSTDQVIHSSLARLDSPPCL